MTTIGVLIHTPWGAVVRIASLLTVVAALFVLTMAVRQRRKAYVVALSALHFVWDAYLFGCLLHASVGGTVAVVDWIRTCPWGAVVALLAIDTALIGVAVAESVRYAKTHLWSESVKSAIDALPVAVCVGTDKTTYLVNVRMNEFCVHAFGKAAASAKELWANVCEKGEAHGDSVLVHGEGVALSFAKSNVLLDQREYTQITAYDVTEQYRITKELQDKHDKLEEVRLRQLEVRHQTEELARSKELLNARVTVHDEIGHILLLGKYYFEHVDQNDEALLTAIRRSNELLLSSNVGAEDVPDEYRETVQWVESIGIGIKLTGDVPHQIEIRRVLAQAIKECATNAVKHADARSIEVKIDETDEEVAATITNDGKPPKGEIVPSGGLLSLKRTVEEAGGTMTVESSPIVAIRMILRK